VGEATSKGKGGDRWSTKKAALSRGEKKRKEDISRDQSLGRREKVKCMIKSLSWEKRSRRERISKYSNEQEVRIEK